MNTFSVLGGRLLLENTPPRPTEDPLWLAATMPPLPEGSHVLDAGCGCGIAGLALLRHQPHIQLSALDIDASLTALTSRNAALNTAPITLHTEDIFEPAAPLPHYHAILCNPPFYGEDRGHSSPNAARHRARCLPENQLFIWLETLTNLLEPNGLLHLILHADCEAELRVFAHNTHALHLIPLQTRANHRPKRVIATLRATSNPTLTLHPILEAHRQEVRKSHLF